MILSPPHSRSAAFLCAILSALTLRGAEVKPSSAALEDPAARAALPEFQTIPAATAAELTPAKDPGGDAPVYKQWWRSQGDDGARRYSALTQINRDTIGQLKQAWVYHSKDGADNVQCTPIVVDGVMYAPTPGRAIVALDAATGQEKWRYAVEKPARLGLEDAPARRGLIYWPGDAAAGEVPRIFFGAGRWFYALDLQGHPLKTFGENGRVPLPTGATTSGAIWQHTIVVTGLYGDVYAFDVRSGQAQWRFHTVPEAGEPAGDTWNGEGKPGWYANCWGGLSVDEARGMVFVGVGAPQPNFLGLVRTGDNLYSNCVLALDAATGRRLWYFQNLRHDLWDLDVCAPPNLVTITRGGRKIDAVTAVSKAGILLLIDRTTGKPIFPFRLRRAPVSKLPGEITAPYQPDPELPEPISSPEFRLSDVTDRTPEAHAYVLNTLKYATYGWFEPFSEGKPNIFIGTRGGAEWSGCTVDVPSGRLYVSSNRIPSKVTVFSVAESERDPRYPPSAGETVYQQACAACHGATRAGAGMVPPLVAVNRRLDEAGILTILKTGRGAMPPAAALNDQQKHDVTDFLLRRNQPPSRARAAASGTNYMYDGFNFLVDNEGYPGIKPPWGLLNCYDLNTGKILWRVPLGEYPELTQQGVPKTGAQNLGGATVTAGSLVFCAGTADRKLRAFDADTGKELWSAELPWGGYAAPAVYEVEGREYVVITATGGGKVGGPTGDAYVAFCLDSP